MLGRPRAQGAPLERILVTGANGHLGRRLIERVARDSARRHAVLAVVRSERAAQTLRELPEDAQPQTVVLDYADVEALAAAAADCSRAVHLVGIIKESGTSRYAEAHEAASHALASAADRAGLRHIVSLSILGSDPDSANACLASKGRAERILLDAPTPATVLRVPMVLGTGDAATRALRAQATGKVVGLVRGGATLQQPIFAGDVIDAILAALKGEDGGNHALNLAGPESLPQRELVARAARALGGAPKVIPVPLWLARAGAALMARVSENPPLTPAMLGVLEHDDAVDPDEACRRLGIALTPLDETLRRCFELEDVRR